jgi:hypothetical protein
MSEDSIERKSIPAIMTSEQIASLVESALQQLETVSRPVTRIDRPVLKEVLQKVELVWRQLSRTSIPEEDLVFLEDAGIALQETDNDATLVVNAEEYLIRFRDAWNARQKSGPPPAA